MKKEDVENLKKQLEEAQNKIDELTNNWKRALADYQNLEKRVNSDRQETVLYLGKNILEKFLEVFELIKAAQSHLNDSGLNLVVKKFQEVLSSEGVQKVETNSLNFDPAIMECVEIIKGEPDGQVAEEISAGYMFQHFLLKPAKVKVYKK